MAFVNAYVQIKLKWNDTRHECLFVRNEGRIFFSEKPKIFLIFSPTCKDNFILTNGSGGLGGEVEAPYVGVAPVVVHPAVGAEPDVGAHRVIRARVQVDQVEDVEQHFAHPHLRSDSRVCITSVSAQVRKTRITNRVRRAPAGAMSKNSMTLIPVMTSVIQI